MDWKTVLNTIAPTAATILGGPLAGLAVEAIGNALGLEAPTVKKVQDALTTGQMNGDQILALKTAEQALIVRMRELDIDIERIDSADRASARERESATGDTTTPQILAFAVTLGFFGVLFYLLVNGKPLSGGDALLVMLGSLGTAWTAIVSYYYGSTKGSADKTAMLARAAK
jgi:hypothetical protein